MQIISFKGLILCASALLATQASLATGSFGKAIGGGIGSGTGDIGRAVGRSLDDLNVGGAVKNAVPPNAVPGNVPRINVNPSARPNINPGSVPNIKRTQAYGPAPNPKSIYGPGPVRGDAPAVGPNTKGPARGTPDGIYDNVTDALNPPRYDSVPPLPSAGRVPDVPIYSNVGLPGNRGLSAGSRPPSGVYDVLNDSVMKNAAELSRTVSARNLNPNLGRTTSRTAIEPVADAAASPGFFKRNKKTLQSVGGGLALGGLGIGGYALGQDIAKGQAGGESKVTDAYNDTAEWATGAYSDAAGWTTGAYGDTVEWGDGAVETVNGWF